jgi:hypothetical protein
MPAALIVSGRRLGFAAVCSGLSLGQMRAQVSHSVVVERLSLSRKRWEPLQIGNTPAAVSGKPGTTNQEL